MAYDLNLTSESEWPPAPKLPSPWNTIAAPAPVVLKVFAIKVKTLLPVPDAALLFDAVKTLPAVLAEMVVAPEIAPELIEAEPSVKVPPVMVPLAVMLVAPVIAPELMEATPSVKVPPCTVPVAVTEAELTAPAAVTDNAPTAPVFNVTPPTVLEPVAVMAPPFKVV